MAKRKAASNGAQVTNSTEGGGVAVAEAPKRGRPAKQKLLNPEDPAFARDKELEDLAADLDSVRTKRISLGTEEKELQDRLFSAMQKRELETYNAIVGRVECQHEVKDKVKIKKPKDEEGGVE